MNLPSVAVFRSNNTGSIGLDTIFCVKMAGSFFPDNWWKLAKPDYERAVMAVKTLAAKDLEPGTKDVSVC